MRPYRGLTKEGKLVYGDVIYANGVAYIFDRDHGSFVDDEEFAAYNLQVVILKTVGRFIGLKDTTGTEGVQGDLIKHLDRNEGKPIEIIWENGSWRGRYIPNDFTFILDKWEMVRAEIIGNIHQPELMEQDNG